MSALSIGLSGMMAAETRLQVSANNIANMRTEGTIPSNSSAVAGADTSTVYKPQQVQASETPGGGVSTRIISDTSYEKVYSPDSSFADKNGMVAAPKVDLAQEMVDQISASLQFSANLKTVQSATTMSQQLLSIRI